MGGSMLICKVCCQDEIQPRHELKISLAMSNNNVEIKDKKQISLNEARSVQSSQSRITFFKGIENKEKMAQPNNVLEDKKRIEKLQEVVHYAKLMNLKIIFSSVLQKGTELNLNAQGLEGSLRQAKDGLTYFGCKKKARQGNPYYEQSEVINDFIIPQPDADIANRHRGRHFLIYYNIKEDNYYIRDLGIGFGSFVRIDNAFDVKDNHMIHIGESFLIINIQQEQDNIKLKVFGGPSTGNIQQGSQFSIFKPQMIKIGRLNTCDVQLDDNLMSKVQCTLNYVNKR